MTNSKNVNCSTNVEHMPMQLVEKVNGVEVGKDVLDLLAGAMYVNPLNIFREYIQNSADAIDEAKEAGLLKNDLGKVQIKFNQEDRNIVIRDNGIGVPAKYFAKWLTNIGSSHKRGKSLRGFRGVGRLSGLGYCQELIFRSRSKGDQHVSEMRWNGRELRKHLRDPSFEGGLSEIVQSIVTTTNLFSDECPINFFEVELRKVSRLKNDLLLNEAIVRDYLAQVAPVPFIKEFSHAEEIQNFLEDQGIREPLHIYIDGDDAPIYHKLNDKFVGKGNAHEKIYGIEFLKYTGFDGDVAAVGWICDHAYSGAIPKNSGLGGIRLRSGNIQVGDESILAEFFPEPRFGNWAIGEIHIISPKILPNGRRDEFEPSVHYAHLQGDLAIQANKIAHQIREESSYRNQVKIVDQHYQVIQQWVKLLSDPVLPLHIKEVASNFVCGLTDQALTNIGKAKKKTRNDTKLYGKVTELEVQLKDLNHKLHNDILVPSSSDKGQVALEDVTRLIIANSKSPKEGLSLAMKIIESLS